MIQLPRRSVTRFFIPLIDVLTLLFCIFLLMPYVKRTGPNDGSDPWRADSGRAGSVSDRSTSEPTPAELAQRLAEMRQELDKLRAAKADVLQERLLVQVLEIDPKTGKLYYRAPDPVEIAGPAEASALITRHKEAAGSKELYYLILFPRQPAGYPTQEQYRNYDRWFRGVAHSFDVPGSSSATR